MNIKRNIHSGYKEWQNIPDELKTDFMKKSIFGKYQYICTSKKGTISIVSFNNRITNDDWKWEIYSYEKLFDDVERFNTLEQAKAKARSYLD
jgi:hypothetical protein